MTALATATADTVTVEICHLDELPVGLGRGFVVGPHRVAVFRTRDGSVFAVGNRCPHKNGPLVDGMLAGDLIVCPLHAFRFDPANGGACDQPGVCAIPTFPAEVSDDGAVSLTVPVRGGAA